MATLVRLLVVYVIIVTGMVGTHSNVPIDRTLCLSCLLCHTHIYPRSPATDTTGLNVIKATAVRVTNCAFVDYTVGITVSPMSSVQRPTHTIVVFAKNTSHVHACRLTSLAGRRRLLDPLHRPGCR